MNTNMLFVSYNPFSCAIVKATIRSYPLDKKRTIEPWEAQGLMAILEAAGIEPIETTMPSGIIQHLYIY